MNYIDVAFWECTQQTGSKYSTFRSASRHIGTK